MTQSRTPESATIGASLPVAQCRAPRPQEVDREPSGGSNEEPIEAPAEAGVRHDRLRCASFLAHVAGTASFSALSCLTPTAPGPGGGGQDQRPDRHDVHDEGDI